MGNRDYDVEDCKEDDSDDVRQPCSRACSRQPTDRHRPHPILPITAPQRRHSATLESSNTKYKTIGRAQTQNTKHLGELKHRPAAPAAFVFGVQIMSSILNLCKTNQSQALDINFSHCSARGDSSFGELKNSRPTRLSLCYWYHDFLFDQEPAPVLENSN